MLYKSSWGCLLWGIVFTIIFFKLKLYYIIYFIILGYAVYYIYNYVMSKIKEYEIQQKRNSSDEKGVTYRICPNCNNNVARSETICPFCSHKFD